MCSAVYGTVHYKELLKSFEIRVGHSPGFGLPSVAILTLCALSRIYTYKRNVLVATVRKKSLFFQIYAPINTVLLDF